MTPLFRRGRIRRRRSGQRDHASAKNGVSALEIQRELGLGSYQTAWTILHRMRRAMVFKGRGALHGTVEIDETFVGGVGVGKRGRGVGNKVLVLIMAGVYAHDQYGRLRLQVIPDAKRATMNKTIPPFVAKLSPPENEDEIPPKTVIRTDGCSGYDGLTRLGCDHQKIVILGSGMPANKHLPAVHLVASFVKRILLSTHQDRVDSDHLQEYMDEFCFRSNRRAGTKVGLVFHRLIEGAIEHDPVTYNMVNF